MNNTRTIPPWYRGAREESDALTFYAPIRSAIWSARACTVPVRRAVAALSAAAVPNIFELTREMELGSLATPARYGGMLFSAERVVAYVADRKPGVALRTLASRLKKHLVWVPINYSFPTNDQAAAEIPTFLTVKRSGAGLRDLAVRIETRAGAK